MLARDKAVVRDFTSVIQNQEGEALWAGLARVALGVSGRLLCPWETDTTARGRLADLERAVGVCYVAQMGDELEFSSASQRKLVDNVRTVMQRG